PRALVPRRRTCPRRPPASPPANRRPPTTPPTSAASIPAPQSAAPRGPPANRSSRPSSAASGPRAPRHPGKRRAAQECTSAATRLRKSWPEPLRQRDRRQRPPSRSEHLSRQDFTRPGQHGAPRRRLLGKNLLDGARDALDLHLQGTPGQRLRLRERKVLRIGTAQPGEAGVSVRQRQWPAIG